MPTTIAAPDGEYEHVCLVSDELEQVEPETLQAELEQHRAGRCQRVVIFNDSYLGVHCRVPGAAARWYWLNLAFLDPRPTRQWDGFWSWVAAAGALLAVAGTLLRALAAFPQDPAWTSFLAAMPLVALAGIGMTMARSLPTLVFRTRHGRAPVLRLAWRRPDRRQVQGFLLELRSAAWRARRKHPGGRGDHLRDEMMEHRRLLEHGVLGPQAFERARALILRAHG